MEETLYSTRLEELFWGGLLLAITMAIHAVGMLFTVRWTDALKRRFPAPPGILIALGLVIFASWMILLVHVLEVAVWARFFVLVKAMPNTSTSYYYSLLQYTTVGSNYNLPLRWRLLEGMVAIAGLMTFAWSTGVLFTLGQDFQDQQLQAMARRRERRHRAQPTKPGKPGTS